MANWTEADLAAFHERQLALNTTTADYQARHGSRNVPGLTPHPRRNRHPEVALQIAIVAHCRPLLVPGARLLGCNGELPGGVEMKRQAAKRKAMGYVRGTADLQAIREGFHGWIEAKIPPNGPTPEQAEFGRWAISIGDAWAVANSVNDAVAILCAWGMVRS